MGGGTSVGKDGADSGSLEHTVKHFGCRGPNSKNLWLSRGSSVWRPQYPDYIYSNQALFYSVEHEY